MTFQYFYFIGLVSNIFTPVINTFTPSLSIIDKLLIGIIERKHNPITNLFYRNIFHRIHFTVHSTGSENLSRFKYFVMFISV